MPTLREYKPSSKKSGYYIRANVGGAHPVTLQVTSIAQTIFQQTGYKTDQSVPTKLVWAMYDLHLLYTQKSLDPSNVKDVSTEDILQELDLGNRLSRKEREKLLSYIEEYQGPGKQKLAQLKTELETVTNSENIFNSNDLSNPEEMPKTEDEAVSYLFTITSSIKQFRDAKRSVNSGFLLNSLQTFIPHPYVDTKQAKINQDSSIRYPIALPDRDTKLYLTDRRDTDTEYPSSEFVLQVPDKERDAKAVIKNNEVKDFTSAGSGQYGLQELENNLNWILPINADKIDKIPSSSNIEYVYHTNTGYKVDIEYGQEDDTGRSTIIYYDGRELQPIGHVHKEESISARIAKVDRISNNGNPVIEIDGSPHILDQGEPGEEYLVERSDNNGWKVISKVIN